MGFITSLCCCTTPGPFDWYGHRVAETPIGADWPDEPNEAEYFYRTPTQWPNDNYSSFVADWWTSQDADTPWTIEFVAVGDTSLDFRIGMLTTTIAPYMTGGEICFSRRENSRELTLDTNEVSALSSWTAGAEASFSGGRLEAVSPSTDSEDVEITSSFTAPANGTYRVIVRGVADGISWILVWIEWGAGTTKLWIDLENETFGAACTGVRTSSLRSYDGTHTGLWKVGATYNAKVTVSGASGPTILIRAVDGNASEVYNGSNGDGVDDLECEIREEVVTDPGIELARLNIVAQSCIWVETITDDAIVDTGTDPIYEDTVLEFATYESVVSVGDPTRNTVGYGLIAATLLESVPELSTPSLGWGSFAPAWVACNSSEIAFWLSDGNTNEGGGDCILIFEDGATSFEYGVGESEKGYIEGALPQLVDFPDDYSGGDTYYYAPIGGGNDRHLPIIYGAAPRAFPIVIGGIIPRATHHEDSSTTPPLPDGMGDPGGGQWYKAIVVEDYTAITAGPYRTATYAFGDSRDPAAYGLDKWDDDWNGTGGGIPTIEASVDVLWEDSNSQTRLVYFESLFTGFHDDPGTSEPYVVNGRSYSGRPTAWSNMPGMTGDSHGDGDNGHSSGAIFTSGRAEISITGTVPWESWDEGDAMVAAPTEDAPVDEYYVKLAIGVPGSKGTVGDDNELWSRRIYRDEDRFWIFNISAVPPREGTTAEPYVHFEKLYDDEDPPTSSSYGTRTGTRVYLRTKDAVIWYFDTTHSSDSADCPAASNRWVYLNNFDADDDGNTSWAFSQEPLSGDPADGPKYRHMGSYESGGAVHLPFVGGAGITDRDTVKTSALVDQTPLSQDYS